MEECSVHGRKFEKFCIVKILSSCAYIEGEYAHKYFGGEEEVGLGILLISFHAKPFRSVMMA